MVHDVRPDVTDKTSGVLDLVAQHDVGVVIEDEAVEIVRFTGDIATSSRATLWIRGGN